MTGADEVTFSLRVMINKEKTKVLFAESDSHFVDILISFLTLPLGRIVKLLEKQYGDKAPVIGCLNTFYNSIVNLDSGHFWTEGAKQILLNPTSSFDVECKNLKLDISDSQPEYFSSGKCCIHCPKHSFLSVSKYYDKANCRICGSSLMIEPYNKSAPSREVFTEDTTTFIITDDLHVSPNEIGLLQAITILGITETDHAELMNVTFGLSEIMNLLKASMVSNSPLSDLILHKTGQVKLEEESEEDAEVEDRDKEDVKEENPNSEKMMLRIMVQKSSNKLLFAQAREDFIEFLLCLLAVPLGGLEHLLSGKAYMGSIDNLYKSVRDLIGGEYFQSPNMKRRLINPKLPHGYISESLILPLTEESLPASYQSIILFSSRNFPEGLGIYIKGPRTYQVLDDLTITPFYISSVIDNLNKMKIPVSDVKELEIHVGLEEALSILRAYLTSNYALTYGLMNHLSKPET